MHLTYSEITIATLALSAAKLKITDKVLAQPVGDVLLVDVMRLADRCGVGYVNLLGHGRLRARKDI